MEFFDSTLFFNSIQNGLSSLVEISGIEANQGLTPFGGSSADGLHCKRSVVLSRYLNAQKKQTPSQMSGFLVEISGIEAAEGLTPFGGSSADGLHCKRSAVLSRYLNAQKNQTPFQMSGFLVEISGIEAAEVLDSVEVA